MMSVLQRLGDGVGKRWCRVMHPDPMWPVRGKYQCPKCHRQFPVPWEHVTAPTQRQQARTNPVLLDALSESPERVHA